MRALSPAAATRIPRRRGRSGLACALGLGLALAGPSARAGEPDPAASRAETEIERARRLFSEAEKAEREGRYAEALEALRQVEAIKATPGVLFHLANCLENLGRLVEALETFERSEALARQQGVSDVLALAGSRIAPLRARVPTVTIRAARGNLRDLRFYVEVDGAPRPATPDEAGELLLRLDPGERAVRLRADGFAPAERRFSLEVGAREAWAAPLVPLAEGAAGPPTRPARPARPASEDPTPAPARSGKRVPASVFVAGGAALALGIGGAVSFAAAGAKNASAREACASGGPCEPGEAGDVMLLDRLALGLWIGAAGAAGLAVTLFVVGREPSPGQASTQPVRPTGPSARLRLGPARLGVEGSF